MIFRDKFEKGINSLEIVFEKDDSVPEIKEARWWFSEAFKRVDKMQKKRLGIKNE